MDGITQITLADSEEEGRRQGGLTLDEITLVDGEEVTKETFAELSNGKGDDDEQ